MSNQQTNLFKPFKLKMFVTKLMKTEIICLLIQTNHSLPTIGTVIL